MRRALIALALGTSLMLAAVIATAAQADQQAVPFFRSETTGSLVSVTWEPQANMLNRSLAETASYLVSLPPGTESFSVTLDSGAATALTDGKVLRMRGHLLGRVVVEHPDATGSLTVTTSGSGFADPRYNSRAFDSALGLETLSDGSGSYVILVATPYLETVGPLVQWKREKGFNVVVEEVTAGRTNADILAWLRNAYQTWDYPPEYVLLFGDVDTVPAWSLSENVTDLPYALMDDNDWHADLMIGRFSCETLVEAETLVAKSVVYEKTPYVGNTDWFNRSLMVGGNYGSETPTSTVQFCGEQLETIGFDPATEVLFPPHWNGVWPIDFALEEGVSICTYRGWAYGTEGWEPPHFTNADIPAVENGLMTPLVMSFVCLNGDYADDDPCFGEAFTRLGTAENPRGAVAFIGNGEHWSHTRYNDAMAISFFERMVEDNVTDLGSMLVASKLRFQDYFPMELEFAAHGEESVEFYCHIYNLLGDPELNLWKQQPTAMDVDFPVDIYAGATVLELPVFEADGETPCIGARVGVVQNDNLLGFAFSDENGIATVPLSGVVDDEDITVTVTRSGRLPNQIEIDCDGQTAFVGLTAMEITENISEEYVVAGETVRLYPTVTNTGDDDAIGVTISAEVSGSAVITGSDFTVGTLGSDQSWTATGGNYWELAVDAAANNGDVISVRVEANGNISIYEIDVAAPEFTVEPVIGGNGLLMPGIESVVTINIDNIGLATTGGSMLLSVNPDVGEVTSGATNFIDSAEFTVLLNNDLPEGSNVEMIVAAACDEGYNQTIITAVTCGVFDAAAPVGPDAYGYYAIDSADIEYPNLLPEYSWTELNPTFGGIGTEVVYEADNATAYIDMYFEFNYYGESSNNVRISDNGWISFGDNDDFNFYNWPIPSPHGADGVIAPFWDNFDPIATAENGGGVFYYRTADIFIVEWSRMVHYRPEIDDLQTFQLVLNNDDEILFLYRQVQDVDFTRTYSTIGIESPDETDGLQLSYSNVRCDGTAPIGSGLAIALTTEVPVYEAYELGSYNIAANGGSCDLAWETADNRPVTGWLVSRYEDGSIIQLTETPLPETARQFVDNEFSEGSEYLITALHPYGSRTEFGPYAVENFSAVGEFVRTALLPCEPNPAQGSTRIGFSLARGGMATLEIYDVAGRLVRTLLSGEKPEGTSSVIWDGCNNKGRQLGAGTYFYRLQTESGVMTRKMLLVR